MFAIAFDNNLNKILLDSLLTVCLKNGRMLKNSLKTDPHFAILFGGTSGIEMTFPLFIYLYSAFNNTDCVKAALQYKIGK